MSRTPRRPRSAARSADAFDPVATGRPLAKAPDARQADLLAPAFIPPCKPTLRARVPAGPLWQYEIKHDGYRVQVHAFGGQVRAYTKSGLDYGPRLPLVRDAAARIGRDAVIDGEAVIVRPDGVSEFFALHAALAFGSAPEAILFAFDLLWLDGQDLRSRPLAERRAMLAEILVGVGYGIELSEHLTGRGEAMLKAACEMGLEGIVAKRIDKPYRSGRVDDWVKVKCTVVDHFAVIGFDPAGRAGVASLKLARLDEAGKLIPCGSVGSGIGESVSRELRAALDGGEPIVVDVEHRGITPACELRHPAFKGWHRD